LTGAPVSLSSKSELVDRLRRKLTAYLQRIDEVMEQEFRPARLADFVQITANPISLITHLQRAELDGLVLHRMDGREYHYVKTEMGRQMEEMLVTKWPLVNALDTGWHGSRMDRTFTRMMYQKYVKLFRRGKL
jgi:DNA topoisomerase VI subunit B